jgi:phage-related protein
MKFNFKKRVFRKNVSFSFSIPDKEIIGSIFGNIEAFFNNISQKIVNLLKSVIETLFVKPFDAMKKGIQKSLSAVTKSIKKMFEQITLPLKWIMKSLTAITDLFKNLFKQMANAFKAMGKKLQKSFQTIGQTFSKIFAQMGKFFRNLFAMFMKLVSQLVKFLVMIYKTIGRFFTNLFEQLKKVFNEIFFYIKCTINKIVGIPTCLIYYLLDIAIFLFLLPIRMVFMIIPALRPIESMAWDLVELVDSMVFQFTLATVNRGIHINQYPNDVLNRCYRCDKQKEDIPDQTFLDDLENMFIGNDKTFFHFAMYGASFLLAIVSTGIIIHTLWKYLESCTQRAK